MLLIIYSLTDNQTSLTLLQFLQIRVFNDGTLYLTRVQLVHAGNYTCHALRNKDVVQTHVLTVHSEYDERRRPFVTLFYPDLRIIAVPEVRVTPRLQSKRPGEEATMWCHVVGEPLPRVEWLKNDEALRFDEDEDSEENTQENEDEDVNEDGKYEVVGNGTKLVIRNIGYADTGAYMCQATSLGGLTRDISSLVIQEQPTPS